MKEHLLSWHSLGDKFNQPPNIFIIRYSTSNASILKRAEADIPLLLGPDEIIFFDGGTDVPRDGGDGSISALAGLYRNEQRRPAAVMPSSLCTRGCGHGSLPVEVLGVREVKREKPSASYSDY